MGQILRFIRPQNAFDPEATAALAAAYEKATGQLRGDGYADFVRNVIAKRIIAIAMRGELDPDRLCTSALASIGFPESMASWTGQSSDCWAWKASSAGSRPSRDNDGEAHWCNPDNRADICRLSASESALALAVSRECSKWLVPVQAAQGQAPTLHLYFQQLRATTLRRSILRTAQEPLRVRYSLGHIVDCVG
jgi:hypothetical protein